VRKGKYRFREALRVRPRLPPLGVVRAVSTAVQRSCRQRRTSFSKRILRQQHPQFRHALYRPRLKSRGRYGAVLMSPNNK
jgi:hypothetical protein